MRLRGVFEAVEPLLAGRVGAGEAAGALYGEVDSADARRIAIYERFCRAHRFEAVDGVYALCRGAIVAAWSEGVWDAFVEAYFQKHPMRSFELNENGAQLPAFLVEHARAAGWPAWLPELADFEWWEWQTRVALDDPADAGEAGPLRLGATVELRPYAHDIVGWVDTPRDERAPVPEARDTIVVFWRDRDLDPRRDEAQAIELAVIKSVYEHGSIAAIAAEAADEDVAETAADLHAAGILRGTL